MQKWIMSAVGLGLGVSIALSGGYAYAQETINADGNTGAANPGSPAADADGPTVVYGDVNVGPGTNTIGPPLSVTNTSNTPSIPGANITATDGNAATLGPGNASAAPGTVNGGVSGTSLLGPDGTYSVDDSPPSNVTTGNTGTYVPPPAETAPVTDDTAYVPPAEESAPPADTTIADSDNDGIADVDETNIYGTDPYNWDTDGDGRGDGEEVFVTNTSPVVWDDVNGTASDGGAETVSADTTATDAAATGDAAAAGDSDGDRLSDADEAALGTDPGNPDSDGDGYYDGDEAALGSDPFDPASVPAATT